MRRVLLAYLFYRPRARLRAFWCRFWGWHKPSIYDWGYGGNGIVDLYCPNCLQIARRLPLDDFEALGDVLDWVEVARTSTP